MRSGDLDDRRTFKNTGTKWFVNVLKKEIRKRYPEFRTYF
jgi:hypothetical protein